MVLCGGGAGVENDGIVDSVFGGGRREVTRGTRCGLALSPKHVDAGRVIVHFVVIRLFALFVLQESCT